LLRRVRLATSREDESDQYIPGEHVAIITERLAEVGVRSKPAVSERSIPEQRVSWRNTERQSDRHAGYAAHPGGNTPDWPHAAVR
jgi:hypothetical protein